jgi:hypothetical protein
MTARAHSRKALPTPTTSVVRHARELAETGDRWFLTMAGGLGKLGGWARREADIAADSAAAAFTTTVDVAKKLTGIAPRRSDQSERARQDEEPAPRRARDTTLERAEIPTMAWSPPKPRKKRSRPQRERAEPAFASHPPGVVPLLQALGRTVADHTHKGYATLEQDERFWTLIHLLQLLSRPIVPPRASGDLASHPEDSGETKERKS